MAVLLDCFNSNLICTKENIPKINTMRIINGIIIRGYIIPFLQTIVRIYGHAAASIEIINDKKLRQ